LEINKLFEEVEENLESHRKVFIRTNLDDDEGDFRSLSDTHLILKSLKEMAITADEMFRSFNSLESLF
jgi:hypothetical protein